MGQGYNGYAAVGKEATWGTHVTPTDFGEISNENIVENRNWRTVPTINTSRFETKRVEGNYSLAGPIVFPVVVDDLIGYFLKDLLGNETYTPLEGGAVGQHEFVAQAALGLPGLSMEISRDAAIANNVWTPEGGHVMSINFSGEAGGDIVATIETDFEDQNDGATPQTPAYSTSTPLQFHTGDIQVDASAFDMRRFNCMIAANLRNERYRGASKYKREQLPGPLQITGEFESYLDNLAEYVKYRNGTAAALDVTFQGKLITGTTYEKLRFEMATVYYEGPQGNPNLAGMDEIFPVWAYRSQNAVAASLLKVTLVNSVTAAY